MRDALAKLLSGQSLSATETETVIGSVVAGEMDDVQIAAALGALRARGETAAELAGAARAISAHCSHLETDLDAIDVCGTGGDGRGTFNISTAVAFVVAGAGVPVAKHGNRAVSSCCGSADVLEALGITIDRDANSAVTLLRDTGFTFLFAPAYHGVLAAVGPLRRKLGVRTTFNLLGPLMNPARVRRQVIGVFDARMLEPVALALAELGAHRAMVVASEDGLDELSIGAPTHVVEVNAGAIRRTVVRPSDAGLQTADTADLAGGDAETNAAIIESILDGKPGAARDVVLLNAAAALMVAGAAASLREGATLAAVSVDSGEAARVLAGVREASAYVAA